MSGMTWADVRYFKPFEFASPDKPDSGYMMDLNFVRKLDILREAVKMPLIITSGYRTQEHNATLANSVAGSAHTTGHAVDIAALSSPVKFRILETALRLGFRRVGIGTDFIHIDDDITKPQDVCWTYGTSTGTV